MSTLLLWAGALAAAQNPSDPWRTLRTENFRIHYPLAAAAWSESTAARLEEWHARVVAEVGWSTDQKIDVVVVDPYSDANGSAIPWARAPRILLYASAPDASSTIGHYRSWEEILLVHEDVHLMHLMRPPRNGLEKIVYGITGFGPVTTKSPRWVYEGYATVVEGKLTGFGRPHADDRALLLRRLAQQGQLPSYGELASSSRFYGGSFAYLAGSAYLEWLEERAGPGSLRNLWARMSARELRTFDEAFEGVFGAPPAELYGRFTAEITASAIAVEAAAPANEAPFQTIGWYVDGPAVSPDGTSVAVPSFPYGGLPQVQVWSIAPDEEAQKEADDRIAKMLARDPEDVAPVPPDHEPHERLHRRVSRVFAARDIRWMPDGTAILFASWARDARGRLRPDLHRWTVEEGRTERITRGGDLRSPDPSPDGTWAAAVHVDWGQTSIVKVDLGTGEWSPLVWTEGAQVDAPRISPDGLRLAWLENDGAGFGVVVRDLATGSDWRTEPGPGGAFASDLVWSKDGLGLLASVGVGGIVDVHEVWRDGGQGRGRLTNTAGGALSPDVLGADEVLYLSMSYRGFDLHRAPLAEVGPPTDVGAPPIRRPEVPDAPPMPPAVPVEPRPYGLGRIDLSPLLGASYTTAASQGQFEVGVRVGDPVGRTELLLLGSAASPSGGLYGGRAALSWRGLPVDLGLDVIVGGDDRYDLRRGLVGLSAADRVSGPWWVVTGRAAGALESALEGDAFGDRQLVYAEAGAAASEPSRGRIGGGVGLRGTVGAIDGEAYEQGAVAVSLRLLRKTPIAVSYERGISNGSNVLGQYSLGGVPSSIAFDPADLWRVIDPAFGAGVVSGRSHDRVSASLQTSISPFVVRHRFGKELGPDGLTAVGLRAGLPIDRQPFARLPSSRVDGGVACRLEWPGQGWERHPCTQVSDYAVWASVTWDR